MKRIGNNEFFASERGAKTAATRRGYAPGATIRDTENGFCLLALGEGADSASFSVIQRGDVVAELTERGWAEVNA